MNDGDGIYLHGFGRHGESIGQTGPYLPEQAAAIEVGRKSLIRLGARHVIRVRSATAEMAAAQAEHALHDPGTDTPPEPRSLSDRLGRVVARIGIRMSRL